jgi:hypothetical protein
MLCVSPDLPEGSQKNGGHLCTMMWVVTGVVAERPKGGPARGGTERGAYSPGAPEVNGGDAETPFYPNPKIPRR